MMAFVDMEIGQSMSLLESAGHSEAELGWEEEEEVDLDSCFDMWMEKDRVVPQVVPRSPAKDVCLARLAEGDYNLESLVVDKLALE
jgi:hypothetical protein